MKTVRNARNASIPDPRHIATGWEIPNESYLEQPYFVRTCDSVVRQAIADAAPGGGFLISSSNSIHSSCKPENLVAMVQAAHEFGAMQ